MNPFKKYPINKNKMKNTYKYIAYAIIVLLAWATISWTAGIVKAQNLKVQMYEKQQVENAEALRRGLLLMEKDQSAEARRNDRARVNQMLLEVEKINKLNKQREQREYEISVELGL